MPTDSASAAPPGAIGIAAHQPGADRACEATAEHQRRVQQRTVWSLPGKNAFEKYNANEA